jgi:hypothetical protein
MEETVEAGGQAVTSLAAVRVVSAQPSLVGWQTSSFVRYAVMGMPAGRL